MPEHSEQALLAPFKQRRQRNLAYFKKVYPGIYRHIKNKQLTNIDLVIKPSRNDVDLKVNGKSLYQGRARAAARHEVKSFCILYDSGGKMNAKSRPPFYRHTEDCTFARRYLAEISQQSPLQPDSFKGYPVDGFYPLLVFMGCGLGYQIEIMAERRDIQRAIVFEPNPEIFVASLYTVDWEQIRASFLVKGGDLEFSIAFDTDKQEHEEDLKQKLNTAVPLFPNGTQYFLHTGDAAIRPMLKQVAEDLDKKMRVGNSYDDLKKRVNNAVHCFGKKIPLIPSKNSISSSKPVLIAGSGPSIDNRLNDIRAVRDHVLLVTAGTGLDGLLANGIRPDVHLELDPNYIVYRRHALNAANVKNIRLLGSPDVYPALWDVFGEGRLYIPQGNPVAQLAGPASQHTPGTGATCTNAAIAIFAQLGFKQIFLFGSDYGFREHEKHHSKHSALFTSDDEQIQANAREQEDTGFAQRTTFEVESTDGQICYTNPTFYRAKTDTEATIKKTFEKNAGARFYNCSDGAQIKGTKWLSGSNFVDTAMQYAEDENVLDALYSPKASLVSRSSAEAKMNDLYQFFPVHVAKIIKLIEDGSPQNKHDTTRLVMQIVSYFDNLERKTKEKGTNTRRLAAWLTKDEMLNFLVLGFRHTMALENDEDVRGFLNAWTNGLTQFLEALPEDFKQSTVKNNVVEHV